MHTQAPSVIAAERWVVKGGRTDVIVLELGYDKPGTPVFTVYSAVSSLST